MTKQSYFKCADWRELGEVNHAFFSRNIPGSGHAYNRVGGVRFGSSEAVFVQNSRKCLAECSPFPLGLLAVNEQVHSNRVAVISGREEVQQELLSDGLVTKLRNVSLGVLTADCAPVLFADDKNSIIGAAHAGWRGALSGVLENTVAEMLKLGADRNSIYAAIGPCIHQENYEVSQEFFDEFVSASPTYASFFQKTSERHYNFDLPGFVFQRLSILHLKSVSDVNIDTFADPDHFFSYRRSTKNNQSLEGSLISVISLS